jgi:hypothetical protein
MLCLAAPVGRPLVLKVEIFSRDVVASGESLGPQAPRGPPALVA